MGNSNPTQPAPQRGREGAGGIQGAAMEIKATETRRARGRPKGSMGKPKNILQKHVAEELLGVIRPLLPQAEYNELRDAIKSGKSVSTLKEVKIMMALMAPPIWQRLIEEGKKPTQSSIESELGDEIGLEPQAQEFARDTNERVKVFATLASLAAKLEEQSDQRTDTKSEPLYEQFKKRGLLAERFTITGSLGPGGVGRDSDRFGGQADSSGTISDQLPEGPVEPTYSEEIEAVGLLDNHSYRSDPLRDNEQELQR